MRDKSQFILKNIILATEINFWNPRLFLYDTAGLL